MTNPTRPPHRSARDEAWARARRGLSVAMIAHHYGKLGQDWISPCPHCQNTLDVTAPTYTCDICGNSGDAVDYLQALTGASFHQARDLILAHSEKWRRSERDRLHAAVPLPVLLDHLGLEYTGHRMRCLDPQAHRNGDVHPSTTLYDDHTHCFGCGLHLDRLGLIQKAANLDYPAARQRLIHLAVRTGPTPQTATNSSRAGGVRDGRDFVPLYGEILDLCPPLAATPGGAYLLGRGIDPEVAHALGVRYLDNPALAAVNHHLETFASTHQLSTEQLQRTGLIAGGYCVFVFTSHRLLFPARRDGATIWLQGRATAPGTPPARRWKGLPGIAPWPLFLETLQWYPDRPVYLCEGGTDGLTLASYQRPVIPLPGANTVRDTWISVLAGREVIPAFDPDAAGRRAEAYWTKRLQPVAAIRHLPRRPPAGTDLNIWFPQHHHHLP